MQYVRYINGNFGRKFPIPTPISKHYGDEYKTLAEYENVEVRLFRIKFPSGKCSPSYKMYLKKFEGDDEVEIEIIPPSTSWSRDAMSVFAIGINEEEAIALATKDIRSKYSVKLSCASIIFNKKAKEKK